MTSFLQSTGAVVNGLVASGLTATYGTRTVFRDLSLTVPDASVVVVTGPNGSGKSTLLACLAGSRQLDAGEIHVFGERSNPSSTRHWHNVYGVLDDFPWLPELTVLDHLMLLNTSEEAVEAAVRAFGVGHLSARLPHSLSSGQRQRCALVTIRLRAWRLLLLDEPERHLDRSGVQALAVQLTESLVPGRCAVLSTHSDELVQALPGRVLAPSIHLTAATTDDG